MRRLESLAQIALHGSSPLPSGPSGAQNATDGPTKGASSSPNVLLSLSPEPRFGRYRLRLEAA